MTHIDLTLPLTLLGVVVAIAAAAAIIRPSAITIGHQELRLRLAAAALRRKASEETVLRPARYREIIREVAKAEAMQLAAADKAMGKQFLQWAEGADLSEILYPAALKAVEGHAVRSATPVKADATFRRDLRAATTVR